MTGKSPDRHWKMTGYKISGQLKRLECEPAELLKIFDGHLADVKSQLAQKKTISAERAYKCFFQTYDELEENRKQQRLLLKQKYFDKFDSDTKRLLEEKSKFLQWVVEEVRFLHDIEGFRTEVIDCRKDTVCAYNLVEAGKLIFNDLPKMEKKLKAENLCDSEKQTLCNQMEELVETIDEMYTEWI